MGLKEFLVSIITSFSISSLIAVVLWGGHRILSTFKIDCDVMAESQNYNNTVSQTEEYLEILRQRFFIDHSSKAKTFVTEEYTIISHRNDITNIILQFPNFLPNLKVYDGQGHEVTVMPNTYTRALIESWAEENSSEQSPVNQLLEQMNNHYVYVIWVKLNEENTLMNNDTIILNFEYSAEKEEKKKNENPKEKRKPRDLILKIYPSRHSIFYIIKKPEDFDFYKRNIIWCDGNHVKHRINNWSRDKQDLLYVTETTDSISLTTKSENPHRIWLNYSFIPKTEIIAIPSIAAFLLAGFAIYLWMMQACSLDPLCVDTLDADIKSILGRRLEVGIFIITSSLILPRLVNNMVIRHRLLVAIGVPILFSVLMMFS
jgi:hypothetical protein